MRESRFRRLWYLLIVGSGVIGAGLVLLGTDAAAGASEVEGLLLGLFVLALGVILYTTRPGRGRGKGPGEGEGEGEG